jgi:hypothetical protein
LAIGVCVCRLGVRNVQCVGVHEIPLKAGWTRWPCNLIKQKTRSRWGFYFFFLLFKHDMWLEGTERAFLVFFFMCCRVHLNPVSLSSLPSTSRATGSKKNFHSSRLNITSEFVIVPPFFLYWKLIPYYYFIASSWNVRNWHRRRLKSNDTMSW